MRGSIVQNQGYCLHLPTQRFGNDLLLHKRLEIDKAFALPRDPVDLAVGNGEPGKQMASATTMIACFMQERLVWACWTRRLLALTSLNGGFLIETDQPGACWQERSRLGISLEYGAGSFEEGDRLMDVLPSVVAPGTN